MTMNGKALDVVETRNALDLAEMFRVRSWHETENREIDEWVGSVEDGLAIIQTGSKDRIIPGQWGETFGALPAPLFEAMPVYFDGVPKHLHASIYRVKRPARA